MFPPLIQVDVKIAVCRSERILAGNATRLIADNLFVVTRAKRMGLILRDPTPCLREKYCGRLMGTAPVRAGIIRTYGSSHSSVVRACVMNPDRSLLIPLLFYSSR